MDIGVIGKKDDRQPGLQGEEGVPHIPTEKRLGIKKWVANLGLEA